MKKYLFVFLILLLLTGCNVQNSHSHTQCPECSKCISEDCNGTENEKCQGHQPVHTHTECQECGKCIAKDCDGAEELKCSGHEHHIYKLTIIDEDSFIYDKPAETSCESDTKIVMHSRPIIDADLAMYINGEFHSIQNTIIVNDETVWEYSFIMPERDTTIEFKTQALEYFNVKTILDIPSLKREDILRITVNSVNLSNTPNPNPIPGSLRVVFSSADYEDITYMLGFLNANVVEDRSDNWQDDTGSCEKYSIYTIDKKYDFEIINGYITVNNKHYKLLGYGPSMSYVMITWAFNTNLDSYEAYTLDGTKIGDFNGLSEFEFYEIKAPLTGVDDYGYLETEFGRIYIHDSKTFYIKDGENYTYYKLIWEWEKDFSDIFNKHKHIECEECGKCIAEDCDGLEEDKCTGHQIIHEHTLCIDCGGCSNENCDGDSEKRCYINNPIVVETEIKNFESLEFMYSIHSKGYQNDDLYLMGLIYIEETISYLPSDISQEYGINIVVVTEQASCSTLYLFYQDEAIIVSSQDNTYKMISNVAITDFNHDNYFEITFGYYGYDTFYKKVDDDYKKQIVMFDTKSKTIISQNTKYIPYFNINNNYIDVYGSIDNNQENAEEYLYTLIPNFIQYEFVNNEIMINEKDLDSIILIDDSEISFPIKGYSKYYRDVYFTSITKWLGESYVYENVYGEGRREGFAVWLIEQYNNKDIEGLRFISSDHGVHSQITNKNDVLLDSRYFDEGQLSTLGRYSLALRYDNIDGNPINYILEDVLIIRKKYIE